MSLIIKAAQFAEQAHRGQVRKYTFRPFIEHPARVASRTTLMPGVTEEVVAAAWLHDVIEDCADYSDLLMANFPEKTFQLVIGLTNPSKTRTDLKRAERKALDREHIAQGSYWVKTIKLIDRIDNIRDMQAADMGFKRLYADESLKLLHAIHALPSDGHLFDLKNELMNELLITGNDAA